MLTIHARSWIRRSQATSERDGRHAAHGQGRGARRQQLHILADRRLPQNRERDERRRHAVRRGRQPVPDRIQPVDRRKPGDGIQDAECRPACARQRAGIGQRAQARRRRPRMRHVRPTSESTETSVRSVEASTRSVRCVSRRRGLGRCRSRRRGVRLQLGEPPLERGDRARQIRHLPLERREAIVHRASNGDLSGEDARRISPQTRPERKREGATPRAARSSGPRASPCGPAPGLPRVRPGRRGPARIRTSPGRAR